MIIYSRSTMISYVRSLSEHHTQKYLKGYHKRRQDFSAGSSVESVLPNMVRSTALVKVARFQIQHNKTNVSILHVQHLSYRTE